MKNNGFTYWIILTILLALLVIILGAYTRLTDAGLGCPDWPGCYGQFILPGNMDSEAVLSTDLQISKAGTEMAHRYLAGLLGMAILVLFLIALYRRYRFQESITLPALLLALVIFQATLGMWTVTWQLLPLVVLAHLLGGVTILAGLWWLKLQAADKYRPKIPNYYQIRNCKLWLVAGFIILCLQIMLGGWVSANYAGVACVGFPHCNGQLLPTMHFSEAFTPATVIGPNYEGGHLHNSARITIQMMHRIGAVITLLYLGLLLGWIWIYSRPLRLIATLILILLGIQFTLGIINVVAVLPLSIAVAHNGLAALLVITLLTLIYRHNALVRDTQHGQ